MKMEFKIKETKQPAPVEPIRVPLNYRVKESKPEQPKIEYVHVKDKEAEQKLVELTAEFTQFKKQLEENPQDPLYELKRRALTLIIRRLELET